MLSQVLLGHGPVAGALRCAVTTWGDSAVECVVPELPAGSYGVRLLLPGGLTPPAPQDFRAELQLDAVTESARAHSYSSEDDEGVKGVMWSTRLLISRKKKEVCVGGSCMVRRLSSSVLGAGLPELQVLHARMSNSVRMKRGKEAGRTPQ